MLLLRFGTTRRATAIALACSLLTGCISLYKERSNGRVCREVAAAPAIDMVLVFANVALAGYHYDEWVVGGSEDEQLRGAGLMTLNGAFATLALASAIRGFGAPLCNPSAQRAGRRRRPIDYGELADEHPRSRARTSRRSDPSTAPDAAAAIAATQWQLSDGRLALSLPGSDMKMLVIADPDVGVTRVRVEIHWKKRGADRERCPLTFDNSAVPAIPAVQVQPNTAAATVDEAALRMANGAGMLSGKACRPWRLHPRQQQELYAFFRWVDAKRNARRPTTPPDALPPAEGHPVAPMNDDSPVANATGPGSTAAVAPAGRSPKPLAEQSPATPGPVTPSRDNVLAAMGAIRREVAACSHNRGLANVRFIFRSNGELASHHVVTGAQTLSPETLACVAASTGRAVLPPFEKETFTLLFPFRLGRQ